MTRTLVILATILALLVPPVAVHAEDRPVVFLHGLMADGSTWRDTAIRLGGSLAIQPFWPTTDEAGTFEVQAQNLQNGYSYLDSSTIAIGHSNGGLVARQWSRQHPLSGIVTVGTAHRGAPLISNLGSYVSFGGNIVSRVFELLNEFQWQCCSWQWFLGELASYVVEGVSWLAGSLGQMVLNIGLNAGHPVVPEMQTGSAFLSDVNTPVNLAREQAEIGSRLGLVYVAHNYYWGGPMRTVFPEVGDYVATARDIAMYALYGYSSYLVATAGFGDGYAWSLANRMWQLASDLDSMDEWWCRAVSDPSFSLCWENDTVVPAWSQDYGALGAQSAVVYGPAHTQETSQSDSAITWALTTHMGVTDRVVEPPPPPPPPPPPAPPDPQPPSPFPPSGAGSDTLYAGTGLYPGESMVSPSGFYHFDYQWDGNLVIYDFWGNALWSSSTWGNPGVFMLRSDGAMLILNGSGDVVWDPGTRGDSGLWFLRLEDSGWPILYRPDGTPY